MRKFNVLALANTFAVIDLVLHPLFHLWGWFFPRSLEIAMGEFVIGLHIQIRELFMPKFFIYWILEAVIFWLLGFFVATIYNKLAK